MRARARTCARGGAENERRGARRESWEERKEKRVFFRAGREDACAFARGREKPFGVRAAEACVVQTPRAWRVGGAEGCALPRMKCRCGDRGRNEGRGGDRNEKGSIRENRSFLE